VSLTGDTFLFFGVLSGLLSIFAFVPYIIDTIKGHTHPERACWFLWSVLGSISLASLLFEGAGASIWFVLVQVSGTIIVFLLSIRRGAGYYLSRRNKVVLTIAALGLGLWFVTDTPAYALLIAIGISLLGGVFTILKAYRAPQTETMVTWGISLAASVCALLSVPVWDPVLFAYPVYLFLLYAGIITAMVWGRLDGNDIQVVWRSRRGAEIAPPMRLMPPQKQAPAKTSPVVLTPASASPAAILAAARVMSHIRQTDEAVQDGEGLDRVGYG